MKRLLRSGYGLIVLALTCSAFFGCQTDSSSTGTAAPAVSSDAARLVIHRAPNLAEMVVLTIDGAKASEIRVGDTYSGSLSAGSHTISVLLVPNQLNLKPTKKSLDRKSVV